MSLDKIEKLLGANQFDDALRCIESEMKTSPDMAELFVLRGKIRMKKEEWGRAINDFNQALEYDPTHEAARNHIQMVRSILGFFNPDLHNP